MKKRKTFKVFPSRFGFFPYIFLVYILFPIYYIMKETGYMHFIGIGMVILFLVTYRQLYCTEDNKKYSIWLGVQLVLILVFSIGYDINLLFLGFYTANFIGWFPNKKVFYGGMIALAVVEIIPFAMHIWETPHFFATSEFFYFIPFMLIIVFAPFGVRSMAKRMELEKQLEQANQQIDELVKREERLRIARDLHDTLGHTLSLLTLKSQLVQRLTMIDQEKAREEAKEMERTSRAALKQVRELVSDMRSATISEELLQVEQFLKAAGISYEYEEKMDISAVSLFIQNVISMCIREAVTNVVKHSNAQSCKIGISKFLNEVKVTIKDDGMGIHIEGGVGNGLKGMEERLALIDGSLRITNYNGAVLEMSIPIVKRASKEGVVI